MLLFCKPQVLNLSNVLIFFRIKISYNSEMIKMLNMLQNKICWSHEPSGSSQNKDPDVCTT